MSTTDISTKNRDYWEGQAAGYDAKPWIKQFMKQVTIEIVARLPWLGLTEGKPERDIKLLDYACGPGIASSALKPYVTRSLGIDISPAMVAEYNTRAKAQGLSPEEMFAVQGNLLVQDDAVEDISPVLKGEDWFDFDIAIVNAGYHHFEDPELAAKRLVERLKPGSGVIVVVDFLEHGGWKRHHVASDGGGHGTGDAHGQAHSHGHNHGHFNGRDGEAGHIDQKKDVLATIAHHGFSVERISACFNSAGCVDVGVQVFEEPTKFGEGAQQMDVKVFMAKGIRAQY